MSKHTPGPWDVQNKGTLGMRSARHEVVAGINVDGSKNLPTIVKMPDLSDLSYANAALIAAAPALLKACKMVYAKMNGAPLEIIEALEAAIAKAEAK